MSVAVKNLRNNQSAHSAIRFRRHREHGSALIEFLLVCILFIFPLLLGTFVFGMSLVRANQVAEVCRDAGHMFAYNVNFSQTSSQNALVDIAQGLNMTTTGGNGVVILSQVTSVNDNDCVSAGYASGSCPNAPKSGQTVFVRRLVIGNTQLHSSGFGTPSSAILDSDGNISNVNYLHDPSAVANNFSSVIPLSSGQFAYMSEMYVISPDFNFFAGNTYWNWISPSGISARSIF
jgi:Flp pilus assembly protein TadG